MKRPLNTLRHGLPTMHTTPLNRLIALTLLIVNTPVLFVGTFVTLITFWAILPLLWYMVSVILYRRYWKIYKDKVAPKYAAKTWERTIILNAFTILIMVSGGIFINATWFFFLPICFPLAIMLIAYTAHIELEENRPERFREAIYTFPVEMNPQA